MGQHQPGTMGRLMFVLLHVLVMGQQGQTCISPPISTRLECGVGGLQHLQGHQHLCRSPLLQYHLPPKSGSESNPPSICLAGKVKSSVIAKSRGTCRIDGDGFPPLFVNKPCWPPPQPCKALLISDTIAVCCANSLGGGSVRLA